MAITNVSKPSTTLTNTTRPSGGLTWALITTTWATETDNWLEASQLFSNATRQTSTMSNIAKP